ncbi:hypothetical protein [Archangium lansingense]|uniref:Uncharacterized protein n=1 Tax=Archangium lansingense TaxID=2995310 RepID=A0ABT4A4N7_9BACT|nr:hypothetical protein [Archangium lansinium]MCY1076326.1 hypothetical protein [Archangium lansinium]
MDERKRIQAVLKALSRAIAGMSEEDCERLLSGRFDIQISLVETGNVSRNKGARQPTQDNDAPAPSPSSRSGAIPEMQLGNLTGERRDTEPVERVPVHKGHDPKHFKRTHGSKQEYKTDARRPSMEELHALAMKLGELNTRDEAQDLLRRNPSMAVRENIAQLAKTLKVYVAKHDDRDTIERKIIEFTVGAKLRTDAIHGLNLKRSGNPGGS